MLRAFSAIELFTTLAISLIALYFFSPPLFRLQSPLAVSREADQIRSFFAQVQSQARFTQRNYALSLAQNNERWCAIAIAKNRRETPACNCLALHHCNLKADYLLYQSHYATQIKASNLYPATLTHIDGQSGNNSGGCLRIFKERAWLILQFQQLGAINVLSSKTRSNCR